MSLRENLVIFVALFCLFVARSSCRPSSNLSTGNTRNIENLIGSLRNALLELRTLEETQERAIEEQIRANSANLDFDDATMLHQPAKPAFSPWG